MNSLVCLLPLELRLVLLLGVVRRAASALRGGRLLHDLRAVGPPPAPGQRGHGRRLGLAASSGEGVHGGGHAEPAQAPGGHPQVEPVEVAALA